MLAPKFAFQQMAINVQLHSETESCVCMKEFWKGGVKGRVAALIPMHLQTVTTVKMKVSIADTLKH